MKIKIRQNKKLVEVEVLSKNYRSKKCFIPGYYTHHSPAGYSGISSWSDNSLSCLTMDNHGCPPIISEKEKEKSESKKDY